MKKEIDVPKMGESVTSGIIAAWLKADGDLVKEGDELFELETDKATLAVPSTVSGVLSRLAAEGDEVEVGQVVAEVDTEGQPAEAPEAGQPAEAPEAGRAAATPEGEEKDKESAVAGTTAQSGPAKHAPEDLEGLSPAVRRIVVEHNLDPSSIKGSGKDGRITKADALAALSTVLDNASALPEAQEAGGDSTAAQKATGDAGAAQEKRPDSRPRGEEGPVGGQRAETRAAAAPGIETAAWQHREKMTSIRKRIAERLVASKQSSAHLTTFNEIDVSAVSSLRSKYRDVFEERHGVRLGYMSFFVKAAVGALLEFPVANAMIDGEDIIYNDRYNIGVAVSTERGLIVPVVKDAGGKSFAEIEAEISRFAIQAREKKISVDDLSGGTFSITNGGVFGSLLSTPIPTPPQSAILGMHSIQKRPVAIDDEAVIRPMMYVALTYDHRIMDGRDAVRFLVRIKQLVEDPEKLLLGL